MRLRAIQKETELLPEILVIVAWIGLCYFVPKTAWDASWSSCLWRRLRIISLDKMQLAGCGIMPPWSNHKVTVRMCTWRLTVYGSSSSSLSLWFQLSVRCWQHRCCCACRSNCNKQGWQPLWTGNLWSNSWRMTKRGQSLWMRGSQCWTRATQASWHIPSWSPPSQGWEALWDSLPWAPMPRQITSTRRYHFPFICDILYRNLFSYCISVLFAAESSLSLGHWRNS